MKLHRTDGIAQLSLDITAERVPATRTPAVTLIQPWASWISWGWKPMETRTHRLLSGLVGREFYLHAGRKWDPSAMDIARRWLDEDQLAYTAKVCPAIHSCIIARCTGVSFRLMTARDEELALIHHLDELGNPRYGLMVQAVPLPSPVFIKGHQGIWYVPEPLRPLPSTVCHTTAPG